MAVKRDARKNGLPPYQGVCIGVNNTVQRLKEKMKDS